MQSVGKAGTLFGKRVALLPPGPPIRLPKTFIAEGKRRSPAAVQPAEACRALSFPGSGKMFSYRAGMVMASSFFTLGEDVSTGSRRW